MTTGIRSSADGSKSYIAVGGTDRVTIDAATGAVGIGTTPSVNSKLAVGGNTPTAGKTSIVGDVGGISLALSDNTNSSLFVKHSSPVTIGTDPGGALAFASNGFIEKLRISATGDVLVTGGTGLGYGPGAGGTVTQATSKSTAVTLNKPTGRITTNTASLISGAEVTFVFNNSVLAGTDSLVVNSTNSNYEVYANGNTAGMCTIVLRNRTGAPLSDAVGINFSIIKGATS